MKLVTAVRPYAPRIRTRVFDHLRAAGCDILEENIVEAGTSDEEAVQAVLARNTPVLLVPFHAIATETDAGWTASASCER